MALFSEQLRDGSTDVSSAPRYQYPHKKTSPILAKLRYL